MVLLLISHEVTVKMLAGIAVIEGLRGAGEYASKLAHSCGW